MFPVDGLATSARVSSPSSLQIFLSYDTSDADLARTLSEKLTKRDNHHLPPNLRSERFACYNSKRGSGSGRVFPIHEVSFLRL